MYNGSIDEACLVRCRNDRKRSSRAAAIDLLVLILVAQDTADVLSQNVPTWQNLRDEQRYSSTSQPMTIAASSKSLIVRMCFRIISLMSSGHSNCHTVFAIASRPGVTTPPPPIPHASV